MSTAREYLEQHAGILGAVPNTHARYVCPYCVGPKPLPYDQCYGCRELFLRAGVPWSLRRRMVPMTTVLNPSPWYSHLSTYKRGNPEKGRLLAAIAEVYLVTHSDDLETLLDGECSAVTIVPSKQGVTFDDQQLRRTLMLSPWVASRLRPLVRHVPGRRVERSTYRPDSFAADPADVHDERVLLVEDTWVTGATSVSAAGAILNGGASSVAIVPIARVVDPSFWPETHPYREAMQEAHDIAAWPR